MSSIKIMDILLVLPLLSIFFFSLGPIGVKVFLHKNKEPQLSTVLSLSILGSFVALMFLILFQGNIFYPVTTYAFSMALVFDAYTFTAQLIVLIFSILSLPFLANHPSIRRPQFSEFIFLYLNSILGMLILIASNDLIVTFIGLELMSLCLYMLITMNNETLRSKEAAIKYFVLGSVASAILLYGISFIYGSASILTAGKMTTHYSDLIHVASGLVSSDRIFVIGIVLVSLGFAFKVSLVPFHMWLPDVYQGASTPLTLFMATAVKAASFFAFLRFIMLGSLVSFFDYSSILQWLAVITMFIGNFGALRQGSIKRMLSYSSIAHSGYILLGLLAASFSEDLWSESSQSVLFYLFAYGLFSIGTFGFLSIIEEKADEDIQMDQLRGLFEQSPWLAIGLSLCLLGLAGIPPTLGFFSKFFLFSEAMNQGLFWLVIWALVNSAIGVYYYLRPIALMFFYPQERPLSYLMGKLLQYVYIFVAVFALFGGIILPIFI